LPVTDLVTSWFDGTSLSTAVWVCSGARWLYRIVICIVL
jgi:hypothetical protein